MPQPTVPQIYPDATALADAACALIAADSQRAIAERGTFSIALSGGSTPKAVYALLASPAWRERIEWGRWLVFWSDERFVSLADPDSSYLLANQMLLSHVPVPEDQVFPVATHLPDPESAAMAYELTLTARLGALPRLDLIMLGMGPDGHTASIFPGQPEARQPIDGLVLAVRNAPKPPPLRVSFSYRLINAAARALFLAAGADKAETLAAIFEGQANRAALPAQGVRPERGELSWMVDAAAAAGLAKSVQPSS